MANQPVSSPASVRSFIRAVLISHFPDRFTQDSLVPKLKENGVDVLRVLNVDRCPDFDPKPADIVICMKDMMSHAAHDRAKLVAKKHNRPFIALSRKAADWKERLARYASPPPPSQRVPASAGELPRPSVHVVTSLDDIASAKQVFGPEPEETGDDLPDELSVEQLKELLAMFENENSTLMEETRHLQGQLKKSDDLASRLERQLETSLKEQQRERERATKDLQEAELAIATLKAKKPSLDSATLLEWLKLIQKAHSGDGQALLQLIERAAGVGMNTLDLLSLVR